MTTAGTWYPPAAGTGGFLADAAPLLSNPPFMYSMTPPDFRALCAELVTELEGWCGTGSYDNTANAHSVIARARTALAQPELEGVTDQEIDQLAWNWYSREGSTWWQREAWLSLARAVIAADRARWARPTIEPVPDTKARELLNLLLDDLDALIDSSEGVAGLHLNGDVASWESLCKGGRFETWLMRMDEARAFLDSTLEKSAIEPVPSAEME